MKIKQLSKGDYKAHLIAIGIKDEQAQAIIANVQSKHKAWKR